MVNGLPAHVLLVHAVVVLVPLAALMAVIAAAWPAARRKLGFLTPLVGLAALGGVPLATEAGEWLEEHVPESPLVEQHTQYGDAVLVWAVGLFLVTCAVWFIGRLADRARAERLASAGTTGADGTVAATPTARSAWAGAPWARAVVGVVTLVIATGATLAVYRAGDSGARAAWQDQVGSTSSGTAGAGSAGQGDGDTDGG
ncbi:DUF2231 domain-containing protein [Cellulomonas soli]|uniref:Uncharacterized protein n=1 Tax=Cellulomonas soli TaxID=931535 RepID=A0A512PFY8_9CELL|nr:DUF2231 domain-containing protein [Cellulomonas soli]NYI59738.1 hypothetical protein [Cellulomonas soli]GEP70119.1 hypothetical protein CSO01_28340 [Cellulomonas soli]